MNYTVSANDVVEVDFDQAGYNFPGKPIYCPFHKTLPKSGLYMYCISVRFYEMGDTWRIWRIIYYKII